MPTITVQLETPICRTFRVEQVAGMFDVPLEEREGGWGCPQGNPGSPRFAARPAATQILRLRHSLTAELPDLAEPWTIGAIVGPSGSGKTTLARAAFGDAVYQPQPWPEERAIIDCLSETAPIKELARVLTAVGLGSVPTWLKPYKVLSTGEKFRADLARAVLGVRGSGFGIEGNWFRTRRNADDDAPPSPESRTPSPLLVFDEFTSTLDRTVAKTASAALARYLRREGSLPRFIALTCHADILPWLAPDWVLHLGDPGGPRLVRGCLPRPPIALQVRRAPQKLWAHFAKHHYLAGGLAASATCYAAEMWSAAPRQDGASRDTVVSETDRVDGQEDEGNVFQPGSPAAERRTTLVAFCAVVATLGWKKTKRIARLVTLPEFQGLGIGTRLAETVAEQEVSRGNRVTITASHPAILAHCSHSPRWRFLGVKKTGSTRQRFENREVRCSMGRAVASFEFVG
jgi:GNAT superfamily N-acetyltransferase